MFNILTTNYSSVMSFVNSYLTDIVLVSVLKGSRYIILYVSECIQLFPMEEILQHPNQ